MCRLRRWEPDGTMDTIPEAIPQLIDFSIFPDDVIALADVEMGFIDVIFMARIYYGLP